MMADNVIGLMHLCSLVSRNKSFCFGRLKCQRKSDFCLWNLNHGIIHTNIELGCIETDR